MADLLAGRYRLAGLLGEGAMGTVHRATDTVSGHDVALKVMNPDLAGQAGHRWRFKQEFWLLARLGHPGIPAAHDLGETEEKVPFFTMEWVPGQAPQAPDPADASALDALVVGILRPLAYLHGAGCFHGDLKPDNCRVVAGDRIKLLDFGLAEPIGTVRDAIRGTPEYLAPEALTGQALDGRLDLYAIGCLVYELVGGQPPFRHGNPWRLFRAHQADVPEPLRGLGTPLALRWDPIVARLLAKDPRYRYPSAAALLEALGADPGDLPEGLLESPLVGVGDAPDRIAAALAGDGAVVAVTGPAGSGKSRILGAVRAAQQVADRLVLVGQADGLPYGAFRPVVAQARDAVRRARPERLAHLEDGLSALLGFACDTPPAEGQSGRSRLHWCVAELLAAAAEVAAGLFIIVDQGELLDPESAALIAELRQQPGCRSISWVIGGRDPASGADLVVELSTLDVAAVGDVAAAMLGVPEAPGRLAELVHAASAGNPRLAVRTVRNLAGSGALFRREGAWELAPDLAPGDLAEAAAEQLVALGEDAARVLECAAACGRPFRPDVVAAALGWEEGRLAQVLDALLLAKAIRQVGPRFTLEPPGRPAPAGELPSLAAALARAFAALPEPVPPEDREAAWELASASGDARAALRAGIASGLQRLALFAAGGAVSRFEALGPLLPEASPAQRLAALRGLADALRLAGRAAEAEAPLGEAIALAREAGSLEDLADLLVSSGKVFQTRSEYDRALAACDEGVAVAATADLDGILARGLAARGRIRYFRGDPAGALEDAENALAAARRAGDEGQEAIALTFLGFILCGRRGGERERGLATLEDAIAIASRRGDRYTLNLAYSYLGNAHLDLGDLPAAREAFGRNRLICRAIGARDEEVFAALNLATVALESAQHAQAAELAREAAAWAQSAGRRFPLAAARALEGAACIALGRPGEGRELLAGAVALATEIGNAYLEAEVLERAIRGDLDTGDLVAAGERLMRLESLTGEDPAAQERLALLRGSWLAARGLGREARLQLGKALASENRLVARGAAQAAARGLAEEAGEALPEAGGGPPATPGRSDAPDGVGRLQACAAFAAELGPESPAQRTLERLATAALALAGADRTLILIHEDGRLDTRLARGAGAGPEDWAYSTTIAKRALWTGELVRSDDAVRDVRFAGSRSVAALQLGPVLCVPLAAGEQTLGVLYLDRRGAAPPFGEGETAAVAALAQIASQALAAAARIRDLERERAVASEISGLARDALCAPSLAGAVQSALAAALRLFPADRAIHAGLGEDGKVSVKAALGPGGVPLGAGEISISRSIVRWVADTGDPIAILDALDDETWSRQQSIPDLDLRAVLCAPLRLDGRVAGAIWLDTREAAVRFGDADAAVLARVCEVLEAHWKVCLWNRPVT